MMLQRLSDGLAFMKKKGKMDAGMGKVYYLDA